MTRFARERFRDRQHEVLGLYLRDPEFRGLCQDYGVCAEEIQRLKRAAASESTEQCIKQFRELQGELEADILERINSTVPETWRT
jgi:hypothetical protein